MKNCKKVFYEVFLTTIIILILTTLSFSVSATSDKWNEKCKNQKPVKSIFLTTLDVYTQITAHQAKIYCHPTCSDKIQNQDETDIDCGGNKCPRCVDGQQCNIGSDCLSNWDDWTREGSFIGTCTKGICGRGLGEYCLIHGEEFYCTEGYCTGRNIEIGSTNSICCDSTKPAGACSGCDSSGHFTNYDDGSYCDDGGFCLNGTCMR